MTIVLFALTTAVLILILKEVNSNLVILVILIATLMIFSTLVDYIMQFITLIEQIANSANIKTEYIQIILKVIGITYITEFGSHIVSETGNGSLAKTIEMGGKLIIITMSIPIIMAVLELIISLLPS